MEHLDNLIGDINEYANWVEQYYTTNPDSFDFVATFGYGDASPSEVISRIETYAREQGVNGEEVEQAVGKLKRMDRQSMFHKLSIYTDVKYYIEQEKVDSIFSYILDEHEEQLPDAILDALTNLTYEEFAHVRKNVNDYLSKDKYLYINLRGHISMTIDAASLIEDILGGH